MNVRVNNLKGNLEKIEVTDNIRALMKETGLDPEMVYRVFKDGLVANKTIITQAGIPIQIPDHAIRLKAAEKMLDVFKHIPRGNNMDIVKANFTFAQMVKETYEDGKITTETKTVVKGDG